MKKYGVIILVMLSILLTACVPRNCIEEGTALLAEKRYESAIEVFEESIEKGLEIESAYKGIGLAQYEMGQYEMALGSFEQAFQNGAEKTPILLNLVGICNMKLQQHQDALDSFGHALLLAEMNAEEHSELIRELRFNEIVCYEKLSDWRTAKIKVDEYLAMYPDDEVMQNESRFLKTR